MTILVRFSLGRILLHVLAMLVDQSVRFHWEGIARELPCMRSTRAVLERARDRLFGGLALYLVELLEHCVTDPIEAGAARRLWDSPRKPTERS